MEGTVLLSSSPLIFHPLMMPQRISTRTKRRRTTVWADYYRGGRNVDENMVVLRKRIHEMKMVERNYEAPSHWMHWEKRFHCNYDATIYNVISLLQNFLMNSRPSIAFGTLFLLLVSVPVSTAVFAFRIFDLALWLLDAAHDIHLIHGQSFENPDILLLESWNPSNPSIEASLVTLTFDTSTTPVSYKTQTIPGKANFYRITHSCDGLVCIYDLEKLMCVMNPATRWQRSLPQAHVLEHYKRVGESIHEFPSLGFGKDNIRGIYKMVWLYTYYHSNHTTCELFSFATNTWKAIRITPFQMLSSERPVYVNGSLYWFIYGNQEKGPTMEILSFDLHTEGFITMSQTPVAQTHHTSIIMSSLNNQICVSVQTSTSKELVDIWLLNPNQTWKHAHRIYYPCGLAWFGVQIWSIIPLAVLDKNNNKKKKLLVYDWNTNAFGLALFDIFQSQSTFAKCCLSFINGQTPTAYTPSLITI